jgi:Cu/Ag efflux protein CusF
MQFIRVVKSLIIFQFFTHYAGLAASERPSVLDPSQHPQSEIYQPIFSDTIQPLDSKLSWTKRFNGDETFNTSETLQLNSTEVAKSGPSTAMEPEPMTSMKMDGQGVIRGLQVERGKVKISHGAIDKYGMPAMTMVFKVEDAAMLEGLKKNQKIGFDVDNSSGGFVVTHIIPMSMMGEAASQKTLVKMDVRGMVKTVRESQGKVKIKHGPIEKYGMPGMTMMFKVSDPALLKGLQKGTQVDFNVDNSSGGFIITDIIPVAE